MNVNGLFKSPLDERDVLMDTFVKKTPPEAYDISLEMPPIKNQRNEGSCAGMAGACVKEWQEARDLKREIILSPRFVYEEAKKISGHTEGTTLVAVMKVLKKHGICTETEWPYKAKEVGVPKSTAYDTAKNFKIQSYARIRNLRILKAALVEHGPIEIGVSLYKGILSKQARETGVTPNPGCLEKFKPLGGHAIVVCGYNDNSPYYKDDGHVKCQGSWGTKFGDDGFHYFSYKYIKANMMDAMKCIDVIGSVNPLRVAHLNEEERKNSWV